MYNICRDIIYTAMSLLIYTFLKRKVANMKDISQELRTLSDKEKCSELFAFMRLKDGVCFQESESSEQSCGRLCDTGNINTDQQIVGRHLS